MGSFDIIKRESRFYIDSPDKAAEALLFAKNLKKFAEEVEQKVKERAVEIMERENKEILSYSITDEETGEVKTWEAKRSYGTVTKEYNPERVLEALGNEATKFFKVNKTNLDKFLKKESAKGNISMDKVELATSDATEKIRKGAGVIIREIIN